MTTRKQKILEYAAFYIRKVWPRLEDFQRHKSVYLSEQYGMIFLCNQNNEIICQFNEFKNEDARLTTLITALAEENQKLRDVVVEMDRANWATFHSDVCEKSMGCHCPKKSLLISALTSSPVDKLLSGEES